MACRLTDRRTDKQNRWTDGGKERRIEGCRNVREDSKKYEELKGLPDRHTDSQAKQMDQQMEGRTDKYSNYRTDRWKGGKMERQKE